MQVLKPFLDYLSILYTTLGIYVFGIIKRKEDEFMVFLIMATNTIDNIDYIDNIEKAISILLNVITGVGIIIGLGYLKSLKDKTYTAAFGFWSQFYNRIYELLRWLKADNSIISNMYSPQARRMWENDLIEVNDRTKEFKEKVQSMLEFMMQESDQMPAYIGWADDYNKLMEFFYDIIQYDICNIHDFFKFCEPVNIEEKNNYCKKIIETMEHICKEIKNRQEILEKRIYRDKW